MKKIFLGILILAGLLFYIGGSSMLIVFGVVVSLIASLCLILWGITDLLS